MDGYFFFISKGSNHCPQINVDILGMRSVVNKQGIGEMVAHQGPGFAPQLIEGYSPPHGEIRLVCRQNKGIRIILAGILLDRLFHTQGDIRGRPDALLGTRTLSRRLRAGENRTPTLRKTKKITIKPTVPIGLSILTISLFPIRIFLLPLT